ncbi:MAG: hypothetical protein EB120_08050 [Proteobacteria bacterium]|nr:hypothetical protein [Pseudomonadota bacterium]
MDPKELRGLMEAYSEVYAPIEELYKGKHGQSETEYMNSRSDAGKQISGDSQLSGAAYSHRSYRGVGGPAKPGERQRNQGKMTPADKNELAIRKANLKKEEVEQIDEVSYSAKAARAGKDIGKPGKMFAKIAKSAAERYGSEERGKKVAGAVLAKLRKEEIEVLEDVLDEAIRGASPHDTAMRRAAAKERKGGIKPLSKGEGERYADYTMAQMNYAKRKRMGEEVNVFDVVLEFLQAEGYAETLEEAEWMMANVIDEEAIDAILETRIDPRDRQSRERQMNNK